MRGQNKTSSQPSKTKHQQSSFNSISQIIEEKTRSNSILCASYQTLHRCRIQNFGRGPFIFPIQMVKLKGELLWVQHYATKNFVPLLARISSIVSFILVQCQSNRFQVEKVRVKDLGKLKSHNPHNPIKWMNKNLLINRKTLLEILIII